MSALQPSSEQWSDRRSHRVESPGEESHVGPPKGDPAAPESLPLTGSCIRAPGQPSRRPPARQLARIESDLSQRDQAVLESLDDFRFLSTGQVQRLHFSDHATEGAASRICRRVLQRLAQLGVIEPLQRRVGGIRAGSASFVWRVGPVGDRLLRQAAGEGARGRRKEPSLRFLDHSLAVTDCYVQLVEAGRAGLLELLSYQTEPRSWRPYLGAHGSREILKPDLLAVTASGDYEDSWFMEVDRGTESLPTVLKKCGQYERYRRTGQEQVKHGVFPFVVWVVPDEPRREKLLTAICRGHGLDEALFRVTTSQRFTACITGGAG